MGSSAPLPNINLLLSPGLVTWMYFVEMSNVLKFASLLLALGCCQERHHYHINNDVEAVPRPVFQASKYGSLWPLPQKVQIFENSFKLSGSSFRIVDAKDSSAGPSCSLLQSAYRRWEAVFSSSFLILIQTPPSFRFCVGKIPPQRRVAFMDQLQPPLCLSAGIMSTCLAVLKSSGGAKTGEQIPPSWTSCTCGSHHPTLNVTVTPVWHLTSHVSPFLFLIHPMLN